MRIHPHRRDRMPWLAPAPRRDHSQALVLQCVDIRTLLRGNVAETSAEQIYCNRSQSNIEAVYAFTIPRDAQLLDVSLELNGRTLTGIIRPCADAQNQYEDAIEQGDSAVMLRQASPGSYVMNVANLLPGETARVRYRYAEVLCWQQNQLRYFVPTTMAPRYGDPWQSGFRPFEMSDSVLAGARDFRIMVELDGEAAQCNLSSPSHDIVVSEEHGAKVVRLDGGVSTMDRDFVLIAERTVRVHSEVLWARDDAQTLAMAILNPQAPSAHVIAPRCINILVDCSGSMNGDSIDQARQALTEILSLMRPIDHFNVIQFGTSQHKLFATARPGEAPHLQEAAYQLRFLQADMGGTELAHALSATYRDSDGMLNPDILLITDGHVHAGASLIDQAKHSGHRIFTVGVGSSVSQDTVHALADATGGACELVSPNESIVAAIVRQFRRITQPRIASVHVDWGQRALLQTPSRLDSIYCGDTVAVFAWLGALPDHHIHITYRLENGDSFSEQVACAPQAQDSDVLARLAGAKRIHCEPLSAPQQRSIALHYQLITAQTSFVLVHARDAELKADALPLLHVEPPILSAGWGGNGSVRQEFLRTSALRCRATVRANAIPDEPLFSGDHYSEELIEPSLAMMDARSIDRDLSDTDSKRVGQRTPQRLVNQINARLHHDGRADLSILRSVQALQDLGLPEHIAQQLRRHIHSPNDEAVVVYVVLKWLHEGPFEPRIERFVFRRVFANMRIAEWPDAKLNPSRSAAIRAALDTWLAQQGSDVD